MKKNFLFSTLAACGLLFAACGQEDILSDQEANKVVSINVAVPGATTRAMPDVADKTRRCIMQVVDAEGVAIGGENMRQTVAVTGDNISFTFAEPEGEYKVVFWADYVGNDINSDAIYNTEKLPTISYKGNKNNMFTAAGDAFCGIVEKGETSATLKRPFNKVNIGTENKEVFKEYTHIAIGNVSVPDAYNILTKTCGDTPKGVRLEKTAMTDAANGEWVSLYVFAPVTSSSVELDFPITLSKGAETAEGDLTFNAKATNMPSDANNLANMNINKTPAKEITVKVEIDSEFTKPADPNALAIGDLINAAGEKVTEATDAVAVVYALPGEGITDKSTYGEGKTVKAYAIALNHVGKGRKTAGDLSSFQLAVTAEEFSGYAFTAALKEKNITAEQSALLGGFIANDGVIELTGQNLSSWYIPSKTQLEIALAHDNATLKANLKAGHTTNYYVASSSVVTGKENTNTITAALYNITDEKVQKYEAMGATASAHIFPALTIFE